MNLTDEYPLVPHYPLYGDRHVLIWWTPSEQHHAVVVDSEEAMLRAFSACYGGKRQYSIPEPKAYWKGTIVRPTQEMAEEHARREFERETRNFQSFTTSLVEHLSTEVEGQDYTYTDMPFGFRLCEDYDPILPDDEDYDYIDQDTQGFMERSHMDCRNCIQRIALPQGVTWERLFEVGRDIYRFSDVYGRPRYIEVKGRVPDDAPAHDPDKPLLIAKTHGGSHCRGFGFDADLFGGFGQFMFCFQGEEHPIPQGVLDQVAEWEGAEQALTDERQEQNLVRAAEYKKKQEALLTDLMTKVL